MIDETKVDLLGLGEAVAGHLEGWMLDREATLKWHTPPMAVVLVDGDGREIRLDGRSGMGPRGKLHVSGIYPTARGCMEEVRPSINVAATRAPEAIARDIVRRFLPDYLETFTKSARRDVAENERKALEAHNRKRLAAALGGRVGENGRGPQVWTSIPGVYVKYVQDTSICMELRLAPDVAVKLAEWVAEHCPKDEDAA